MNYSKKILLLLTPLLTTSCAEIGETLHSMNQSLADSLPPEYKKTCEELVKEGVLSDKPGEKNYLSTTGQIVSITKFGSGLSERILYNVKVDTAVYASVTTTKKWNWKNKRKAKELEKWDSVFVSGVVDSFRTSYSFCEISLEEGAKIYPRYPRKWKR